MMPLRSLKTAFRWVILLGLSLPFGTACHEIIGHGLIGVLCGGHITYVEVLGFQVWPYPSWLGWQGRYGACEVADIPTATGEQWMALAGALSTWCVSVIAVILLWLRRWRGWPRAILVCLGLWWIDLLTYTLPSWGLRRSLFWGPVYSEPYEAATALGMRGPLFQALVIGACFLLAAALIVRLMQGRNPSTVAENYKT